MKTIPLTQDKFAIVDDEDFDWLNQWKWSAIKIRGGMWYAIRNVPVNSKQKSQLMHRTILGLGFGDRHHVDHIDRNSLDNRRRNIRICNQSQNLANARKRKDQGTSRFKGVSWSKASKKFRARITIKGKEVHLGYFDNEEEAALLYDKTAKRYFGEFARLNFVSESKQCDTA